jgi:hypothetical protein
MLLLLIRRRGKCSAAHSELPPVSAHTPNQIGFYSRARKDSADFGGERSDFPWIETTQTVTAQGAPPNGLSHLLDFFSLLSPGVCIRISSTNSWPEIQIRRSLCYAESPGDNTVCIYPVVA